MKTLILFILAFSIYSSIFCQTQSKDILEAERNFYNQRYSSAITCYLSLLKTDSSNANLNYKIGMCYLNSRSQKAKAIVYLEKAIESNVTFYTSDLAKETDAPIDVFKHLGDVYHKAYQFDMAISMYKKYIEALSANKTKKPALIQDINQKIEICQFAKELKESMPLPTNFKLINQDKKESPVLGNYSSTLSKDKSTMIYTLKIPITKLKKTDESSKFYEDINHATKIDSLLVKKIKSDLSKNTNGAKADSIINVATVGSSLNGQIVLTYRNDNGESNVYMTKLIGNQWVALEKLDKCINNKGWESNECISADGHTMYFTSNKTGGFGGIDIYTCKKLPNGEWGKAINLGPTINTPYDDEAPFIHPDRTTLYFSSNKNKPLENFDVFTSSLTDSATWTKPLVIGYPLNSNTEDGAYQVATGKRVFTSKSKNHHQEQPTENTETAKDNFMVSVMNSKETSLTLLKGEVTDALDKTPCRVKITVTDNETGEVEGTYFSDHKTGLYSCILPSDRNHNMTYEAEGYMFNSENITISKGASDYEKRNTVKMPLITKHSKITLNNIFFDLDTATVRSTSLTELNTLFCFLAANPTIVVKISNYIYTNESKDKIGKLSKARALAVVNYLIEKGIPKEQLIAKGYRKSPQHFSKKNSDKRSSNLDLSSNQKLELEIKAITHSKE